MRETVGARCYQRCMGMCWDCGSDLDHCHGTLVIHGDGTVECTDGACIVLDPARHTLIIPCGRIAGGCACNPPHGEPLARAS